MTQFSQVNIDIAANIYFDGQVTSRKIMFSDGTFKTLGIMMPGEYEFSTVEKELMEITAGNLDILLPEATQWLTIKGGEHFYVPANARFKVKVKELTDYCCSYLSQ
ncbi:pyrimidine/purine nucleoside phosphorylase [Thalassotalea piscium]